jgi:hypothetical protein
MCVLWGRTCSSNKAALPGENIPYSAPLWPVFLSRGANRISIYVVCLINGRCIILCNHFQRINA